MCSSDLIVVDDADRLDDAQLLELARIADAARTRHLPLEVLLIGTPALPSRFASPSLSALRERIGASIVLARLSANDTREYLQTRLSPAGAPCTGRFSRKASRDIHQESLGLIAVVEAIAAESLRQAETLQVSPEHVRTAARLVRAQRDRIASATRSPQSTLPRVTPMASRRRDEVAVPTAALEPVANATPEIGRAHV